jgi:hypothetical protein
MVVSFCAYCNQPLPARRSRGPAASCYSRSCRQSAYRARVRQQARLEPLGLAAQAITPARAPADAERQVAQAILDGRSVAGAFNRLSREARVEYAWSCGKIGEAMFDAMNRCFSRVRWCRRHRGPCRRVPSFDPANLF